MTDHVLFTAEAAGSGRRPLFPGYLLTPLGWAAQPLATIVAADPRLLPHVFDFNRPRMHLIALALAHLDSDVMPKIGRLLVRGSARHILNGVLGRCPVGIKGVLRRLPFAVLRPRNYRRLIDLLEDAEGGKLLVQDSETDLTDAIIEAVYDVPPALRSVVLAVVRVLDDIAGLGDGLRLLAARGAAPSFDDLVADLAGQVQPAQFIARLRHLVAELPLPDRMPPPLIGNARRLDSSNELRLLARDWQNCLGHYMTQVDDGTCAIYLWDDPISPAACHVSRRGRLGWVLQVPLGPNNTAIEDGQLAAIYAAFAAAGVPQVRGAYGLHLLLCSDWQTSSRQQQRCRNGWQRRLLAAAWDAH